MGLPMKRYPRWDRAIMAVFSLLAFSSHAQELNLRSNNRLSNFNAFVEIEKFDKCVSNLQQADADSNDLRLKPEEYLEYISLESNGRLSYEAYQDLPLSLLANYLFTACLCSISAGSGCCVGDKIGIQLDEEGSGFISGTIVSFCISVDSAIQGLLPPTPSPSLAPTRPPADGPTPVPSTPSVAPTITASNGPTGTPTKSPTVSPSSTPTGAPTTTAPSSTPSVVPTNTASNEPTGAPTKAPTVSPSSSPTGAPSVTASDVPTLVPSESPTSRPSMAPVQGQTDMPTTAPSQAPTLAPTLAPSQAPTNSPSSSPTEMPSVSPTAMPSVKPTLAPTKSPTEQPSSTPSATPSTAPTPAPTTSAPSPSPTQIPTPEELTCVRFQYGISNDNGFSASDIFNEVNNTYKTGLIIATRNVTIETLNATFPRDGTGRLLREISNWRHRSKPLVRYGQANKEGLGSLGTRGLHVANLQDSDLQSFVLRESKPGKSLRSDGNRRRAVYLPQEEADGEGIDVSQLSRQLVFYTDEYPVTIDAIIDNPFCGPSNSVTRCAVVASTVCTLLEDGDDEGQVQIVLLTGIRVSIRNGDFEDAIPPEHQLPPV